MLGKKSAGHLMEVKNHKIIHLRQQKGGRGRLIEVAVE